MIVKIGFILNVKTRYVALFVIFIKIILIKYYLIFMNNFSKMY